MVTSAPDSTVLICTGAPIVSGAVGAVANISMTDDPGVTAVVRFLVPSGQTWIFEDLYISTAAGAGATVDPVIRIFKDGGRIMGTTPPLSNLLVSNNSRPPYSNRKFLYRGGQTIQMQMMNTVVNDTAVDNITFFVRVRIISA